MNNTIYFTVLSFFYSLLLIYILIKKRKKLYKDNDINGIRIHVHQYLLFA